MTSATDALGPPRPILPPLRKWFDLLLTFLRGGEDAVPEVDRDLLKKIQAAATTVGGPLLDAPTREELLRRTDVLVTHPMVQDVLMAGYEWVSSASDRSPELAERLTLQPELRMVLGDGPVLVLEQATVYILAAIQAYTRPVPDPIQVAYESIGGPPFSVAPTATTVVAIDVAARLVATAVDPSEPPEVRELILKSLRAAVSSLAIMCALDRRTRLDRTIALALCEMYLEGQRASLTLAVSAQPTEAALALVPEQDRLDLPALQAAHQRRVAEFGGWFDALPEKDRAAADAVASVDRLDAGEPRQ